MLFYARRPTTAESPASIPSGQFRQILQVDVVHGVQDITPNLPVFPVEPLEDIANLLTLARILGGARIDCPGKGSGAVKPADGIAVQEGEGADHGDLAAEEGLPRKHGCDLGAIENVHEEGLDEVIEIVPEGDLGAP